MDLRISRALLDAIGEEARKAAPHECCGLLLGDARTGEVRVIRPTANVAADPAHCFEIDPVALLAAHKAARTGGPALIGHYHSHPGGEPIPSATDAALAEAQGEYWLIAGAGQTMRAWRAGVGGSLHGRFEPVEIRPGSSERPCTEPAMAPLERP